VGRAAQRSVAHAERQSFEVVRRFDQAVIGDDLQAESFRHRAGRLLGPLEGRAEQCHHGPFGEKIRCGRGHLRAVRGQVEVRQAPVYDVPGVFHLAVPEQVDDG
jgi:hypothetical protein